MVRRSQIFLGLLLPFLTTAASARPTELFDAEGYRQARFQAPVTLDPLPAHRIAAAAAASLRPGVDAIFIDVLPPEGGVRDPKSGRWHLASQHLSIAGAIWHPEVGRSPPDPVLWRGLRNAVTKARKLRPGAPIILFCRTDCWMGWNAARRLAIEGFPDVWWLAEGVEGWRHQAGKLVPVQPQMIAP